MKKITFIVFSLLALGCGRDLERESADSSAIIKWEFSVGNHLMKGFKRTRKYDNTDVYYWNIDSSTLLFTIKNGVFLSCIYRSTSSENEFGLFPGNGKEGLPEYIYVGNPDPILVLKNTNGFYVPMEDPVKIGNFSLEYRNHCK